jgi:hypothetical protein
VKTLKGLAVTAGAATLAAMALTGCGIEFNPGTHRETKSYEIPGDYPSFKIHGNSGKLEVIGTDRPGIRVQERLRWSNKKNKPKTERSVENGTLRLSTDCAHTVIGYTACGADYRVEVPKATKVSLDADSGAVTVRGLTGDSLRLTSDSGSIKAAGIRTKTLVATSESGRIVMDGQADSATLRADSGAIDADALNSKAVIVHAESGRIRLGLTTVPDSVDASLDSGKVELTLPAVAEGYAMSLSSDSGEQHIAPGLRDNSASPHRVQVRTESGAIRIEAADPA